MQRLLTFGNFSRVTGTTSDATDGAQLEVVKPNGIDVLRLLGNNISVSANNVARWAILTVRLILLHFIMT